MDGQWLLGWRDIVRSTDESAIISSTILRVTVGGKFLQKYAGTFFKYYPLKQLSILSSENYKVAAPWDEINNLVRWVRDRLRELTYTSWDLEGFAREMRDTGNPFVWEEEQRFAMRAELDAAYFHLYGVGRDDVGYIMDSFGAFWRNDAERFARTKALILDVYDAMARAVATGEPYKTILDPPPGEGPRHPDR